MHDEQFEVQKKVKEVFAGGVGVGKEMPRQGNSLGTSHISSSMIDASKSSPLLCCMGEKRSARLQFASLANHKGKLLCGSWGKLQQACHDTQTLDDGVARALVLEQLSVSGKGQVSKAQRPSSALLSFLFFLNSSFWLLPTFCR
jgi:hypothetical protein